jgi:monoamine oxidase
LHTLFEQGQFAEAGASRIPSDHNLTLSYCEHFHLELDPFYPDINQYFNIQNQSVSFVNASNHLNQPPWQGSVLRSQYSKIRGGTSNLPKAFLNFISDKIYFSQPVLSVTQKDTEVEVTTQDMTSFYADRVLCTVPLPVLNKINFTPALSPEKMNASNNGYNYTDSSRLFTQFSTRFWLNDNLNAWGNSDHPEEIWQPTWDDSGSNGIIKSYLRNQQAQQFDQMSPSQQIESIHNRWKIALPNLKDHILTSHSHSWSKETWSGSAYASPSTVQNNALSQHIGTAENRIHFAGEHASNYHGWMQGALESGIRAANEIHANT